MWHSAPWPCRDKAFAMEVGRWGEELVHLLLLHEYREAPHIRVRWLNSEAESGAHYDLVLEDSVRGCPSGHQCRQCKLNCGKALQQHMASEGGKTDIFIGQVHYIYCNILHSRHKQNSI